MQAVSDIQVSADLLSCIRPAVRGEAPYHVGAVEGTHVKLNQNENPYDLPEELKRDIVDRILAVPFNRYPAERSDRLHRALAEYNDWDPEGFILGNGSNELMYLVGQVLVGPGTPVVLPSPMFSLYEKIIRLQEGRLTTVPPRADLGFDVDALVAAIERERPALTVVTSPNNPTGRALRLTEIERIVAASSGFVLVDEAYLEFNDEPSVRTILERYPQIVVLRTFSKAFGLAGLRLGYLMAHPAVMREFGKARVPFMVDRITEAVALALFEHRELLLARVEELRAARDRMSNQLRAIDGVEVVPSQANFVIFKTPMEPGSVLSRLAEAGVLVRSMSGYPELRGYIRVNAGTPDENKQFTEALRSIILSGQASH